MNGIRTFLFTDIEGSTRRWEADADAMRVALDAHNKVLRETVAAHDGTVFNYTGDGMCAVFASPRSAVDAAIDAQRALELPVRMGIATGEAELRGDGYFGTVLNRTARVMAAGHGGQILLDGVTAGLLSGVDLISLGPRRLRDIVRPVDMFQVHAADLRSEFPALKTLDSTPGNLRPQTTSFIGRESELAELEAALKAHRLVTLTGVGGVGKTRLALELAGRSAIEFPDGVWVIELASVGDPSAVPEAVAAVLGIIQQPGLSLADSVATTLEGRSRLLVFDNCEHVLDSAADMIETILDHSTTVKVLATSREGLRLRDEWLWPVPSLNVHTGADSAAATLFVDRAQAVSPAVSLAAPGEADVIVEICRRLDGIPLGIELAASRMLSMSVTEIRDRLDDRFRLLVGSRRGLERHQTLRHAVEWSYDLLDEAEKALLTSCSVFAGGFDLQGACAVAGSDDDFATLDLLDSLVRKSLLAVDTSSGRARFSMLETIRQFAEEQLAHAGAADEVRSSHARYFGGRETDVLSLWDGPHQRGAYDWFTAELANLRAAFRWAADRDDLDTAGAIAFYATFLGIWTERYEPVAWAEELVEPAKAIGHRRLAQLYATAAQCYATGRIEKSIGYIAAGQQAIVGGHFDEVPYEFDAFFFTGYLTAGEPERTVDWCRTVISRNPGPHNLTHAALVISLMVAGAYDEAVAASGGLLAAADATDNPVEKCLLRLAYGWAYRDVDPAAADDALRRGLSVARDSGNQQQEASIAVSLARLAVRYGQPTDAFDYIILATRHYYDSGSLSLMPGPLGLLAVLFDRLGQFEAAASIIEFAATPINRASHPEIDTTIIHLREILGNDAYESFARAGTSMTNAAMAEYAFGEIDRVCAEVLQ
jgi:predicted ATPase